MTDNRPYLKLKIYYKRMQNYLNLFIIKHLYIISKQKAAYIPSFHRTLSGWCILLLELSRQMYPKATCRGWQRSKRLSSFFLDDWSDYTKIINQNLFFYCWVKFLFQLHTNTSCKNCVTFPLEHRRRPSTIISVWTITCVIWKYMAIKKKLFIVCWN